MAENAREIVLDTLLEIERNKVYSNQLLKAVLDKYDYLESQDKRFIKRLTEGCIERRIELDYYLNQYASVPVNKMKPLIRCLMRMGVYQILYMDSIPDAAACNEAVKLAVKRKFVNLKGFVNGVLRKIAANKENMPLPEEEKEPLQYLSVKYSMPEWIVEMWLQEYGKEDTQKILEGLSAIHPVSVRFRTDLTAAERATYIQAWEQTGAVVQESTLLPYVYTLTGVDGISSLEGFEEGTFTVQDVSSALSVEAAGIKATDICMDICAAPGGKTMLAAEKAARVLSRDVSEHKVELIQENCRRMQIEEKVTTEVWDATVYDAKKQEYADIVLMDVPCSGLGVMGKKRDIKYHVTPDSLESLTQLQKLIVESSWQYVKKGGVLLYSTCTINKKENQEMVKWICESFPFVLEEERQLLPGFEEADGFYYARLRRRAE
ncbi:MAG: 16S rRNA (cytosine(967)-C(5))-methyltransferase RsmB [Lachnospiraceae bacterium]|nr:16S rRNA (cytosine(967)-C(5))-methyltransferase RsmB [Lachnospiraceae bacterium]